MPAGFQPQAQLSQQVLLWFHLAILFQSAVSLLLWSRGGLVIALNTQVTRESLVRVVGRCEVGITGFQPNISAW